MQKQAVKQESWESHSTDPMQDIMPIESVQECSDTSQSKSNSINDRQPEADKKAEWLYQ